MFVVVIVVVVVVVEGAATAFNGMFLGSFWTTVAGSKNDLIDLMKVPMWLN